MKILTLSLWLSLTLICFVGTAQATPSEAAVVALLEAAQKGDNAKLQSLLKQGVDVNSVGEDGLDALALAAQMNHLQTVNLLLSCGANIQPPRTHSYMDKDGNPLLLAAYGMVNSAAGAMPPKLAASFHSKSKAEGRDQLNAMIAWRHGYYDIIQTLLQHGADVNAMASNGDTALIRAAFGCDLQTVKLLLDHGANVNAKTSVRDGGRTALMSAAMIPWPDSGAKVKLLLERGADLNVKDQAGNTALTYAKQNHLEISGSKSDSESDAYEVLLAEIKKNTSTSSVH